MKMFCISEELLPEYSILKTITRLHCHYTLQHLCYMTARLEENVECKSRWYFFTPPPQTKLEI